MRWKLVVRPDGGAMLTTEEDLTPQQFERVREIVDRWPERESVLIVSGCEVVQVKDLEVDLGAGTVSVGA